MHKHQKHNFYADKSFHDLLLYNAGDSRQWHFCCEGILVLADSQQIILYFVLRSYTVQVVSGDVGYWILDLR